jgi:sortase (surface protein transpeptidase)
VRGVRPRAARTARLAAALLPLLLYATMDDDGSATAHDPTDTPEATAAEGGPPAPTTSPVTAPPASALPEPTLESVVEENAPDPVRVQIPRIGVDADVVPLGLDASKALEVPEDAEVTGWWTGGPEPGEKGPAVIAGHLDSRTGPAVFYHLRDLRAGDVITVLRSDQSRVDFTVARTEQHAKAVFPTEAVYGPTPRSELRLVTCGGAFDRSTGHYVDNVIVFASRVPEPTAD